MSMSARTRPEAQAPPEFFYNETEAKKYLHSTRMIEVQAAMSERALEMLCLPEDTACLLLDVGCGTGLSGETLREEGHSWIGVDISADMLRAAKVREADGDLIHRDMGRGMNFRQGVFDGAISISALQWLCYSNDNNEDPRKRLTVFFQSLYKCLRRGARAVLQFYPQVLGQPDGFSVYKLPCCTASSVCMRPSSLECTQRPPCSFASGSLLGSALAVPAVPRSSPVMRVFEA
eukprot:5740030-Pleurochrysis_carterae.AAC.1